MIVGTAGHIDHGKTALVRALTGTDTDRLPEEKRRGISIELGYAFLQAGAGRIAFVDVPGHERFVHTMLAGASGFDFGLLVVAADDGPMPQTEEHLAVLALLGVQDGCVALTKIDRVDAARVQDVEAQLARLLAGTPLAAAPVFRVDAIAGTGVEALKAHLLAAASRRPARADDGRGFRIAIDRVFTIKGAGTVVTGSAAAGRVRIGDELELVPGGRRVRVRAIHANGHTADQGLAGERVALQVAGAAVDEIGRGQWLCDPAIALATDRVDARVAVWRGERTPLRAGTTVHLHHGTSDLVGTVALLEDRREVAPGDSAIVQLVLRKPAAFWRGDAIVLRDAAAQRTIGGGPVLDPLPPRRYRRTAQRLAALAAAELATPAERLHALLACSPGGVDLAAWSRAEGRTASAPLDAGGVWVQGEFAIALGQLEALEQNLVQMLARFHEDEPDQPGLDSERARRKVAPLMASTPWSLLLRRLAASGRIVQRGAMLALLEHEARIGTADEAIARKVLPRIEAAAADPPWLRALAAEAGETEEAVRAALVRVARRGEVHQVVPDLFYSHALIAQAARIARELAAKNGAVRAADLRELCGLRRKRAVQVLEYFDRVGLLRRIGDVHKLRPGTTAFS